MQSLRFELRPPHNKPKPSQVIKDNKKEKEKDQAKTKGTTKETKAKRESESIWKFAPRAGKINWKTLLLLVFLGDYLNERLFHSNITILQIIYGCRCNTNPIIYILYKYNN